MAADHAMTSDMGSTSRGVDTSPPRDSDVLSTSQTGYAKKEFIMMPPEEKLKHFDSRAQAHEGNQEDLVRCVALTRLVYGEEHLKLAQAHARLAKAYFQFKGWGLQAQEYSALARELLPFCTSISSCRGEKLEFLTCLLSVHLTQGGASLLTANLEEAESSFVEAEQALEKLYQHDGINQEEKIKTELEISTSLSRVYKRQNRPDEALSQCERSLQLLRDCGQLEKTCSVYRDMAAIEQDKGHLDRAIEHLSKAHAIAMSHSLEKLEGAQISHRLALILCAAAEPHHNDGVMEIRLIISTLKTKFCQVCMIHPCQLCQGICMLHDSAGQYFEQSLSAYKNSAGAQDPAFLATQDDFCRFLLLNGQQERCVEIQRASLATKRSTFGDLSAEVADTLQLIGSVEMTEGKMKQAHRTMTRCLEIHSLLYGPQHKKTKATQKAVDMLARAPEVAESQQRQGRRKTKPHTLSVVPSRGNDGNSMSDS
ncbi:tetratricopeptide repeat protein 23 isoform X2 [Micropterus dolomieu]|uniref:tetratricopeptide repeat protein 23 isoform X2 n=1 Tax=Micropterus dolomieu TaxID=147949 RepID=UPI001E8D1179|nr:tetratricopeptide repeat protein 23 isoform X2 [Micropterus dolomieu]